MKAVFLDRDGVINIDSGYVYHRNDFVFLDGIFDLLKLLKSLSFTIFIVTNQSGIARGYYKESDFLYLMEWVKEEFHKNSIEIKEISFCPHHPEITGECLCRKPKAGMLIELEKKYNINMQTSIMIGDKNSDIQACQNARLAKCYKVKSSIYDIIHQIKNDYKEEI